MADHHHHSGARARPWKRLADALRFERSDLWTVIAFAMAVGVLSIALSLASIAAALAVGQPWALRGRHSLESILDER